MPYELAFGSIGVTAHQKYALGPLDQELRGSYTMRSIGDVEILRCDDARSIERKGRPAGVERTTLHRSK